jgi:hypothetical protein
MSFWKSLFGGGKDKGADGSAGPVQSIEHEGFLIEATPLKEGEHFLISGVISKTVGGERKEHRFIRADRCTSLDSAAEMTIRKGRQIIEQMGERMFK